MFDTWYLTSGQKCFVQIDLVSVQVNEHIITTNESEMLPSESMNVISDRPGVRIYKSHRKKFFFKLLGTVFEFILVVSGRIL